MTAENLFLICNYGILPFWLLLVVAPRWKGTQAVVHSVLLPAVLGIVYIVVVLKAPIPEGAGGTSLKAAMLAFSEPWTALACWIHFLVLDLFVGAWEVRDARRQKIPHVAVILCLVLTNLFAPAGLLLYLAVRGVMRRTGTLEEQSGTA